MKLVFFLLICVSFLFSDFSRNNGVVIDSGTNLQWQDDYSDNSGNIKSAYWADALTYCENLTLNSQSDWRLPNINELLSILDFSQNNPAMSSIFQNYTYINSYWTSTTRLDYTGNAWEVHFGNGSTGYNGDKTTSNFNVRCVRGP